MSDVIARGEIEIDLRQGDALSQVKKLVADVHREIDTLKTAKADIPIGGDDSKLQKDLTKLEAELKKFTGIERKLTIAADTTKADAKLKATSGEAEKLDKKKVTVKVDVDDEKAKAKLAADDAAIHALDGKIIKWKVEQTGASSVEEQMLALRALAIDTDKAVKLVNQQRVGNTYTADLQQAGKEIGKVYDALKGQGAEGVPVKGYKIELHGFEGDTLAPNLKAVKSEAEAAVREAQTSVNEELNKLQASAATIRVDADTEPAQLSLDSINLKADELDGKHVEVKVHVATDKAKADFEKIDAEIKKIGDVTGEKAALALKAIALHDQVTKVVGGSSTTDTAFAHLANGTSFGVGPTGKINDATEYEKSPGGDLRWEGKELSDIEKHMQEVIYKANRDVGKLKLGQNDIRFSDTPSEPQVDRKAAAQDELKKDAEALKAAISGGGSNKPPVPPTATGGEDFHFEPEFNDPKEQALIDKSIAEIKGKIDGLNKDRVDLPVGADTKDIDAKLAELDIELLKKEKRKIVLAIQGDLKPINEKIKSLKALEAVEKIKLQVDHRDPEDPEAASTETEDNLRQIAHAKRKADAEKKLADERHASARQEILDLEQVLVEATDRQKVIKDIRKEEADRAKEAAKRFKEEEGEAHFLNKQLDERSAKQKKNFKEEEDHAYFLNRQHDERAKAAEDEFKGEEALAHFQNKLFDEKQSRYLSDESDAHKLHDFKTREAREEAAQVAEDFNVKKEYADKWRALKLLEKTKGKELTEEVKLNTDVARAKLILFREDAKLKGIELPVNLKVNTDKGETLGPVKEVLGIFGKLNNLGSGLRLPIPGTHNPTVGTAVFVGLAPLMSIILTSMISLVGVIGSGLVGALGVAGGLFAGFAANIAGGVPVIKAVHEEISQVQKAFEKLSKEEHLHGAQSKQAIKSREEYNNALKNVAPDAAVAAKALAELRIATEQDTKPFRKDLLGLLGDYSTTGKKLLPTVSGGTNELGGVLAKAGKRLEGNITSPEAIKQLDSLGKSANAFAGPFLKGLEKIGAALAHIGESGARLFGGKLGQAFADWGKGLDAAYQPGSRLDGIMRRLGKDAEDTWHFLKNLGALLKTVFVGSAPAGDNLLVEMTETLHRWNEELQTTEGKKHLGEVFKQGTEGMKAFAPILKELIKLMSAWLIGLTPFTDSVLEIANAITKVVVSVGKFVGFTSPLKAIGEVLAAIFVTKRVYAWTSGIAEGVKVTGGLLANLKSIEKGNFFGSIGKIFSGTSSAEPLLAAGTSVEENIIVGADALTLAGERVAAALSASAAEIGVAGGAAAGVGETGLLAGGVKKFATPFKGAPFLPTVAKDVAPAAVGVEALAASEAPIIATEGAVVGLSAALSPATLGLSLLAGGAIAVGLAMLHGGKKIQNYGEYLDELKGKYGAAEHAANKFAETTKHTGDELGTKGEQYEQAKITLARAKEALAKAPAGSLERREDVLNVHRAEREVATTKSAYYGERNKSRTNTKIDESSVEATIRGLEANERGLTAEKEEKFSNKFARHGVAWVQWVHKMQEVRKRIAHDKSLVEKDHNRAAAEVIEQQRELEGLGGLGSKETQELGSLANSGHAGLAGVIGKKYSSAKQVGAVAERSSLALAAGVSSAEVTAAVTTTKTAGDAIKHLSRDIEIATRTSGKKVVESYGDMREGAEKELKELAHHQGPLLGKGEAGAIAAVNKIMTAINHEVGTGAKNAGEGTEAIGKALREGLELLGDKNAATKIQGGVSKIASNLGNALKLAGGGLVQFGQRGASGRDNIPVMMGQQQIVVGSGEQGAVFTKEQQAIANEHLAPIGGLPGLFSKHNKPHYLAQGGFTGYSLPLPKNMMGGNWSIDQGVDINGGTGAIAGQPLFAIGPGNITLEGISGFGPNAPVLRITSGPLKGREIYYGHAGPDRVSTGASVHAGQQISEVGAGIVGKSSGPHLEIGFYPPGAGSAGGPMAALLHQLLSGAGVTGVGGVGGGGRGAVENAFKKIKIPHLNGNGGMAHLVNAFFKKFGNAANKFGEAHGGSGPAAGAGSGGRAHGTAQMRAWAKAGLQAAGLPGNAGEVDLIVYTMSHESGGNPHSENTTDSNAKAGHPSRGLMELIPENFAQYHVRGTSNNVFDPVANVAASVRYMIARYGHIVGMSPYERGGMLPYGRGGLYKKPALLVGEHNHEWVIDPKHQRGPEYLKQAGEEMGYNVTAAAVQKKPAVKQPKLKFNASEHVPDTVTKELKVPAERFSRTSISDAIPRSELETIVSRIETGLTGEQKRLTSTETKRKKDEEALKTAKRKHSETLANAEARAALSVDKARKKPLPYAQTNPQAGTEPVEKGKLANAEREKARAVDGAEKTAALSLKIAAKNNPALAVEKRIKEDKQFEKILAGKGGKYQNIHWEGIPKLKKDLKEARSARDNAVRYEEVLEEYQNKIAADGSKLGRISAKYKKNHGAAELGEWNAVIKDRSGDINYMESVLHKAIKDGQELSKKPWATAAIKNQLKATEEKLEEVSTWKEEGEEQQAQGEAGHPGEASTLTGPRKQFLEDLETKLILAQTRTEPDKPNTPINEELSGLTEQLGPAEEIKNFWEQELAALPATATDDIKKEIAASDIGARSQFFSLQSTIEGAKKAQTSQTLGEVTAFSQARLDLFKNYGSNFAPIFTNVPSKFEMGGMVPSGTIGGKETNVTVNNHFTQPPTDPHIWSNGVAWELQAAI